MKKKALSLALVIAMSLSLVACGDSREDRSESRRERREKAKQEAAAEAPAAEEEYAVTEEVAEEAAEETEEAVVVEEMSSDKDATNLQTFLGMDVPDQPKTRTRCEDNNRYFMSFMNGSMDYEDIVNYVNEKREQNEYYVVEQTLTYDSKGGYTASWTVNGMDGYGSYRSDTSSDWEYTYDKRGELAHLRTTQFDQGYPNGQIVCDYDLVQSHGCVDYDNLQEGDHAWDYLWVLDYTRDAFTVDDDGNITKFNNMNDVPAIPRYREQDPYYYAKYQGANHNCLFDEESYSYYDDYYDDQAFYKLSDGSTIFMFTKSEEKYDAVARENIMVHSRVTAEKHCYDENGRLTKISCWNLTGDDAREAGPENLEDYSASYESEYVYDKKGNLLYDGKYLYLY